MLDHQRNIGIATPNNVPLIVNGDHGVSGIYVQKHVVEERKGDSERSNIKSSSEGWHAKENHKKVRVVAWMRVQFAKTIQDMQNFALHGPSIVQAVPLSRAVADNPAGCAN